MSESLPPPRRSKPVPKSRSQYELRPNSGALFFEDTKKSVRHPDCQGKIRIEDRVFSIAGWMRTSQSGKEYLSLAVDKEFL
jgi:hypothetical protein